MWWREHTLLTLSCVYIVSVGTLALLAIRHYVQVGPHHAKLVNRCVLYAVGAFLWPFVWSALCGDVATTSAMPLAGYLGLVWPLLWIAVEVGTVQHTALSNAEKTSSAIQFDANSLSGVAFAIGGLLVRYVSDGFASASSPMFLVSILLPTLFVMPNPSLHPGSATAQSLQIMQKLSLQYSLGFVITALSIAFGIGMQKVGRQGSELAKAVQGA